MKQIGLFFLLVLSLLLPVIPAHADILPAPVLPAAIRVGLESKFLEVDSVAIGNASLLVGYGQGGVFFPLAQFTSQYGGFTISVCNSPCLQLPGFYATYDQALAAGAGQGIPTLLDNGSFGLLSIGQPGGQSSDKRMVLSDGSQAVLVFEGNLYPEFSAGDGLMALGDRQYRGVIEFGRYQGQKITAVNVVAPEDYLRSVVPSEIPQSWDPEALKAQAVAARTYILFRTGTGVHADEGYDLCDTNHCQTYLGATNEAASTDAAVAQTAGQIAYYGGQPIQALYFSSDGGATENSEDIWSNALPYLRSVPDPYEYQPTQWIRSFTYAEITSLLQQNGNNIGSCTGVSIGRLSANGHVTELDIQGAGGTVQLTKDALRVFFTPSAGGTLESHNFTIQNGVTTTAPVSGAAPAQSNGLTVTNGVSAAAYDPNRLGGIAVFGAGSVQNLAVQGLGRLVSGTTPSSAASQPSASIVNTDPNGVTFVGQGWGHGVGMSQRGAKGLAQMGYSYIQILKYYYTGIEVY